VDKLKEKYEIIRLGLYRIQVLLLRLKDFGGQAELNN
jgi:hypothetical protein